jgi:hypothetical protein
LLTHTPGQNPGFADGVRLALDKLARDKVEGGRLGWALGCNREGPENLPGLDLRLPNARQRSAAFLTFTFN